MGCTKFGELWNKSAEDLIVEAFTEAIEDAGIGINDIQAAWFSTQHNQVHVGHSGIPLSVALKLPNIGVTHVENQCASGTEALRGACYAVASGACDIALALGVEKLKDIGYAGLPEENHWMVQGTLHRIIGANMTGPGMFAMMANRYFKEYDISPQKGKEILAMISVKSHHNGALNPKAHLRREVTLEDVINAPIVAWPLGLYDCCGVSDGAAAAIVVKADRAKDFRSDSVNIKALQISADSGESMMYTDYDLVHVNTTTVAAARAYEEAGIKNPREEVGVMEVHDCFSITELVTMEDLQISPRGKAPIDVENGLFDLGGKIPCQPSGGLKCFGHPIGASGLRMVYEIYKQIQGKSGDRQVKDPKYGLTHNLGGAPHRNVVSVCILGE